MRAQSTNSAHRRVYSRPVNPDAQLARDETCPKPACKGKVFKLNKEWYLHLLEHAWKKEKGRPFKCPVPGCFATFGEKDNLTGHVNAAHCMVKPWICRDENTGRGCDLQLARIASRTKHRQKVHKQDFPKSESRGKRAENPGPQTFRFIQEYPGGAEEQTPPSSTDTTPVATPSTWSDLDSSVIASPDLAPAGDASEVDPTAALLQSPTFTQLLIDIVADMEKRDGLGATVENFKRWNDAAGQGSNEYSVEGNFHEPPNGAVAPANITAQHEQDATHIFDDSSSPLDGMTETSHLVGDAKNSHYGMPSPAGYAQAGSVAASWNQRNAPPQLNEAYHHMSIHDLIQQQQQVVPPNNHYAPMHDPMPHNPSFPGVGATPMSPTNIPPRSICLHFRRSICPQSFPPYLFKSLSSYPSPFFRRASVRTLHPDLTYDLLFILIHSSRIVSNGHSV